MKNILKIVLSVTLVVVIQHQSRPKNKKLYMDNGKFVYQANCGGIGNKYDMGDCLKLAGRQCPEGFNILMQNEEVTGMKAEGDVNANSHTERDTQWNTDGNSGQSSSNSRTSFNANSKGGQVLSFSRYIIYTCKTPENN